MRFQRLSRLVLMLLLAASLPLRAYALPCESPSAHAHAGHCEHGAAGSHGVACDCCAVAAAMPASGWALPHDPAAAVIVRLLGHSPILTLDRLDRPPRRSA